MKVRILPLEPENQSRAAGSAPERGLDRHSKGEGNMVNQHLFSPAAVLPAPYRSEASGAAREVLGARRQK